jgi:hypothetical protein
MKGVVFSELIEMIGARRVITTAQKVIVEKTLPLDGWYINIGTFPNGEVLSITEFPFDISGNGSSPPLKVLGYYLLGRLLAGFSKLLSNIIDSFGLFLSIEKLMHVEVKKL